MKSGRHVRRCAPNPGPPSERDREVVQSLLSWFCDNKRTFPWREEGLERWQFLVVEMLLQQTQAERVAAFIPAFFREYSALEDLVNTDEGKLAHRLAILGLQHRRANKLQEFARAILAQDGLLPNSREELEALPGVGPYVAAAYLSAVLEEPEPMVDVNMARLIERLYGPRMLADIRYDPHINGVARRLIELAPRPRDFNWAVVDIGAAHCTARSPACEGCPLISVCPFGKARVATG